MILLVVLLADSSPRRSDRRSTDFTSVVWPMQNQLYPGILLRVRGYVGEGRAEVRRAEEDVAAVEEGTSGVGTQMLSPSLLQTVGCFEQLVRGREFQLSWF